MPRPLRTLTALTALLALLLLPVAALAQQGAAPDADEPLSLDPEVRTGTLDNGLRYFIRPNAEPKNRAALRLAVDAGSVLEDEDQRGLAHFNEHMLFNGTRRFEKQEIVDFLESTGMEFGPDVNAYTSFDETVYMLQVPTDSARILERSFDVLEDWAGYATLSDEEIEKERGVVLEERRARYESAGGRIQKQTLPVVFHDSRYAERVPIGEPEIIENASPETLRRFYQDWYRPDLMAVVAVGDFDPDRIEALVKDHFSTLKNPDDERERAAYDVPDHSETLYEVAADPEYPRTNVQVLFKRDHEATETTSDLRDDLVANLFSSMLNDRLEEVARQENAPFLGAGTGRGNYVRPLDVISLTANTQEGEAARGLEGALTEAERVRQHGFTASELERHKEEILRSLESAYQERENTASSTYARRLVSHFLAGDAVPGIEARYQLAQKLLPTIGTDEVNALADDLFGEQNRVVIVDMPEKEGLAEPTEEELAAAARRAAAKDLAPYQDETSNEPLVSSVPAPADVTSRSERPDLGITELTLANGVRVVMKPTDFKEDQVLMRAFSPGGSSLVSDADYFDAQSITSIMNESGVAGFTPPELEKKLAGKTVSVQPYIGSLEEGFRGSASPKDLETLFQLTYLYATEPRADSTGLRTFQRQQIAQLKNRSRQPIAALIDTMQVTLSQGDPRSRPPTVAKVENLDMAQGADIYRNRFADLSDFTFAFVGNFEPQRLEELARTYLGTLPATNREETWRDVRPAFPDGVTQKTVHKGQGQRSFVAIVFGGDFDYTRQHRYQLGSMGDVLAIRLREQLREEMGGVYSAQVQASASDRPDEDYNVFIIFSCDPARADELADATFAEIDSMQSARASAQNMQKVTEQQRRARETSLEENGFWANQIDYYYSREGADPATLLRYPELVDSLTAEDIQEAARRYLSREQFVRVTLLPEEGAMSEDATGDASSGEE